MPLLLNTIRARLLSGFFLLILITVGIFSLIFYFYEQIETMNKVEDKIDELMMSSLHMMSLDEQFLKNDIENSEFFEKRTSPYLAFRDSLESEIFRQLYKSKKAPLNSSLDIDFDNLIQELEEYNNVYNEVLDLYREKGFKDFGVEGEMRHWAKLLEDSASLNFKKEWILLLRRYEKDYIIRKDSLYVNKFESYSQSLIQKLNNQNKYEAGIEILKLYRNKFRELVKLDYTLGIEQNSGKKYDLFQRKISTINSFSNLSTSFDDRVAKTSKKAGIWVLSITSLAILLSLVLSILLANRFSKPVKNLSENIKSFLYKDWKADLLLDENIDILELKSLTQSYKKLVSQLKDQFEETMAKSEELDLQNSKLLKLGEEMDQFVSSSSSKLRAPLNSLQGLTELIKLKELDTNDPQTIAMMEQALGQIENYLAEINEYVELRKDDIQTERFDLKKSIKKIINDKKIKSSLSVNIRMEIEPNLMIDNDPKRFSLIMNHIIDNAFQYYDRDLNKLNLFISARPEGNQVSIEIHDDGLGIEPDQMDKVFNMYYRASHYSKGSGLGLYIAKASLKTMGGKIDLQSNIGEGTKVFIVLPLDAS